MEDQTGHETPEMQSSHRTKTKKTKCLNAFLNRKSKRENQQELGIKMKKTAMR